MTVKLPLAGAHEKSSKKKRRLSQKQIALRKRKRKNLENYAKMRSRNSYYAYVETLRR